MQPPRQSASAHLSATARYTPRCMYVYRYECNSGVGRGQSERDADSALSIEEQQPRARARSRVWRSGRDRVQPMRNSKKEEGEGGGMVERGRRGGALIRERVCGGYRAKGL